LACILLIKYTFSIVKKKCQQKVSKIGVSKQNQQTGQQTADEKTTIESWKGEFPGDS